MRTIKPVGKGIHSAIIALITCAPKHGHCPFQNSSYMTGYYSVHCSLRIFLPLPMLWLVADPQVSQFSQHSQGNQNRQEIPASYAPTEPLCNSTNKCRASHHTHTAQSSAQGLCHCPCGNSSGTENQNLV